MFVEFHATSSLALCSGSLNNAWISYRSITKFLNSTSAGGDFREYFVRVLSLKLLLNSIDVFDSRRITIWLVYMGN